MKIPQSINLSILTLVTIFSSIGSKANGQGSIDAASTNSTQFKVSDAPEFCVKFSLFPQEPRATQLIIGVQNQPTGGIESAIMIIQGPYGYSREFLLSAIRMDLSTATKRISVTRETTQDISIEYLYLANEPKENWLVALKNLGINGISEGAIIGDQTTAYFTDIYLKPLIDAGPDFSVDEKSTSIINASLVESHRHLNIATGEWDNGIIYLWDSTDIFPQNTHRTTFVAPSVTSDITQIFTLNTTAGLLEASDDINSTIHNVVVVSVPIGAVINWWCPEPLWPVPDGFQICNGDTVADLESPLYRATLPNLTNKFIMGVTDLSSIDTSGGDNAHDHIVDIDHNHDSVNSDPGGSHNHSVDPPGVDTSPESSHKHTVDIPRFTLPYVKWTSYAGMHNHIWAEYFVTPKGDNQWTSFDSSSVPNLLIFYKNGIGRSGKGTFPLALTYDYNNYEKSLYTDKSSNHQHPYDLVHDHPTFNSDPPNSSHRHSVNIEAVTSDYTSSHVHIVDLPILVEDKTSSNSLNLPPYYGLLKIMRIK